MLSVTKAKLNLPDACEEMFLNFTSGEQGE